MDKQEMKVILANWLEQSKQNILKDYVSMDIKASGNFGEKLRAEIIETPYTLDGLLIAPSYSYFMEYGRAKTVKDGDGSLYRAIRKWIDDKGIVLQKVKENSKRSIEKQRDSLAYAITKTIHEKGTKTHRLNTITKVISNTINQTNINKLLAQLKNSAYTQVRTDVLKFFGK